MSRLFICFLACFLMLTLPLVSAQQVQLPISGSYGPFTGTVSSYMLADDGHGGTVYGSVRSNLWVEVHVLSAYATVASTESLGRADLQGSLVLKPHSEASASVVVSSPYTVEQLADMPWMDIQNVKLHGELRYCIVLGWWCFPVPYYSLPAYTSIRCDFTACTLTYERTLTIAEISQLAQVYG